MSKKFALIFGGSGALGRAVVTRLKTGNSWRVANVDLKGNAEADQNFRVDVGGSLHDNKDDIVKETSKWLAGYGSDISQLGAVICTAGGFEMGSMADDAGSVTRMWQVNANTAFQSASVAAKLLGNPGVLVLTGAKAAFQGGTSFAVGYGMSKAATHHIARSFADEYQSSKDTIRRVRCILPVTIDTPMNREQMPNSDFSQWSKPSDIAEVIAGWCNNPAELKENDIFVDV